MATVTSRINISPSGAGASSDTFGSWSNLLSKTLSTSITILNFSNGDDTGWTLTVTDEPPNPNTNGGVNAVGTGDAAWVDEAIISAYGHGTTNADIGVYTISGLNDTATYNIKAFGSRITVDANRMSEFSVDGFSTSQIVNSSANSTLIAEFLAVSPSAGVIDLSFRSSTGGGFGYINAIEIQGETDNGGDSVTTCGKDFYFLGEHSNEEQANSLADYLPDDCTFIAKNTSGTNTRIMLEVFANQLEVFEQIANIFTNEMSPECADQLMSEWENMLGIPDDCFAVEGEDLEDRQRNALIKLAKMNVQTNEDFTNLAEAFGVTATVESGIDSGIVFPGGDEEARFTIVITFIAGDIETFPFTFPMTFGTDIISLLECIFSKVKPANCNVVFIEVSP